MKKIFTTAMLALLGAGAFAQTSQGTVAVSGSVNFGNEGRNYDNGTNTSKSISSSINLYPSVGYFVKDGLELGIGLALHRNTSKARSENGENLNRSNNITLSPYAKKYVPITEQFQLYGVGFVSVGVGNRISKEDHNTSSEVTHTSTSLGVGVSPGLTYFATPKLGFSATFGSISFTRYKETPKDDQQGSYSSTNSSFTARLTPSYISIGIGYFIAR